MTAPGWRGRILLAALILGAVAVHLSSLQGAWRGAQRVGGGNDFASYHYATRLAAAGDDPYDVGALRSAARRDGLLRGVHPFFYPPPFLLSTAWTLPLSLRTAYRTWFWLDELAALLAGLALARWWRALGPAVPVALLVVLAALDALPNNHVMGQMNLPVLALVVGGLWADARERTTLAGVLLGVACMLKMAPALFVAWWLLHRRWRPVAVAVATAVAVSVLALPLVGLAHQLRFYVEVLPGFGSGSYNGLSVGIDLFGNHSLANLFDERWPPDGRHVQLTDAARRATTATVLALVTLTAVALRRAPADPMARAGQVGAVSALTLLVPVYTYEHHLVWLVLPAVAVVAALVRRRLAAAWWLPVLLAWGAWCVPLVDLKAQATALAPDHVALAWLLRESKLGAVLVLYAAALVVGRSSTPTLEDA
ncbi:MAG: DUF2029 domain-containing protein [Alphaproteobacteria bacterium]|nr:DUF2029 domain-containing protein [Alphaproteobacteria bacterium]